MQPYFRDAVASDVEQIAMLVGGAAGGPTERIVAEALDEIDRTDRSYVMVAELGGRIVAVLQLVTVRRLGIDGRRRAEIDTLAAVDDADGRVVGDLIERAIERAAELGCDRIRLHDHDHSSELARIGEHHGFVTPHHGLERPLAASR